MIPHTVKSCVRIETTVVLSAVHSFGFKEWLLRAKSILCCYKHNFHGNIKPRDDVVEPELLFGSSCNVSATELVSTSDALLHYVCRECI